MERPLLYALRTTLVLALATPVIVSFEPLPKVAYPFIVGKALYFRFLVECAFALWVILIIRYPHYRPPRTWLLIILLAYVSVSLLTSFTGSSVSRSLWSNYERMQGWIGLVHLHVFAIMLASVFRDLRNWRIVLGASLLVGLVIGFYGLYETGTTERLLRVRSTLGNPSFLASFALLNAFIAAAFIAGHFDPPDRRSRDRPARRSRGQKGLGYTLNRVCSPVLLPTFWTTVLLIDMVMVYQSGTRGAVVGLIAGITMAISCYLAWGSVRRLKLTLIAVLIAAFLLLASAYALRDTGVIRALAGTNSSLERLLDTDLDDASAASRINALSIGWGAFKERPLLGWGPENYYAAYDRHLTTDAVAGGVDLGFDQAHNRVAEELVVSGAVGLAAYLALWSCIIWVLAGRIRKATAGPQLFAILLLAGFAAYFVQNLFLFDTPGTSVQLYLLIGYVLFFAGRSQSGMPDARPAQKRKQARGTPARSVLRTLALSAVVGAALIALVYHLVVGPYMGARNVFLALGEDRTISERFEDFDAAVRASPDLANLPIRVFVTFLGDEWLSLSEEDRRRAIAVAERQVSLALQREPLQWRLHLAIARLYQRASVSDDPGLVRLARAHTDSAIAIAPERIEVTYLRALQYSYEGDHDAALDVVDSHLGRASDTLVEGSRIHRELGELRLFIEGRQRQPQMSE